MAIEVAKVELKNVQDASGLEAAIDKGQFRADEVIAVIGKTEGNGGVNDFHPHPRRPGVSPRAAQARQPLRAGDREDPDGVVRRLRRRHHAARDDLRAQRQDRPGDAIAARHRHGDERRAFSRGHRPAGDGREGRRRRARGDARRRHRRSGGRALRADQDAAPDRRFGRRRACARQRRRLRGARLHGRVERHHRPRHRRRARRDQDAEGRGNLPQPRPLLLGRLLLVRRRTDAGADRASRQQERRRRPLSHRPRGDAGRARHRLASTSRSATPASICRNGRAPKTSKAAWSTAS